MKEKYHISGMTCSACVAHVEKAVRKLEGVKTVSVNLLTETMDIVYDDNKLNAIGIVTTIEKAGYGADRISVGDKQDMCDFAKVGKDSLKEMIREEEKGMKWRLGISVLFLALLMYVAMYHMFCDLMGLPIPDFILKTFYGNENAMTFALTQLLLLLPILYMNRKFFAVGFKALGHFSPNMDSLIAIGASAALGYGIFAMYRISFGLGHGDMALVEHYSHNLYYESAGMILTLITVGKYLESRSKGKTGEAITKLMDLSPKMAVVLNEKGEEMKIPTGQVKRGDIFLVKPGSLIPVDGTVIEGTSGVDESAVTGESIPVEKQIGDKVVSATLNKAGFLKCQADRVGDDTTLSQIIRLVEEASASKAPIAKLADKVAGIFVPIVILIAICTFFGWLLAGQSVEFAISTAIAVLVISCPCALGLATPVAIMVGTGVGAKYGVLIKSGEALQRAKEIDTVVLDKTGTITEGRLTVLEVNGFLKGVTVEQILSVAAAVEKKSEHPLAEAVIKEAESFKCKFPDVQDFKAVFGRGIEGILENGEFAGCKVFVGNQSYLEEQGIFMAEEYIRAADAMSDEGMTPLWVAAMDEVDLKMLGQIGVADEIKRTSKQAIKALNKLGIRVVMLTGDNMRTAESVRKRIGIEEVIAQVLPQEKEKHISDLKKQGHKVAMIGDGINDAPALAAADVGMAIGAGTDVAIESADIILMKNDLRDAVTAIYLSRAVIRNIKQNLFWAFFYNSIGIPLAAGLLYPLLQLRLSPMFAAAAMSMSSVFVVGNALRLRRFKSILKRKEEKVVKKVMKIEGMMCSHCTGRVQKVLQELTGVRDVVMSLENKTAVIVFDAEVEDDILKAAVTDAGYEVLGIVSE